MSDTGSKLETIYLTGAPASGKSTVCASLIREFSNLHVISYSAALLEYMNQKRDLDIEHRDLRERSSAVITAQDIDAVDKIIVAEIRRIKPNKHVILDSHPITKEDYGFRATPFSLELLCVIGFTAIVCLYASSENTIRRLDSKHSGRLALDEFGANAHTQLQFSLAVNYGVQTGVPAYFVSTDVDESQTLEWFRSKLGNSG